MEDQTPQIEQLADGAVMLHSLAQQEINKWLDYKKLRPAQRQRYIGNIAVLVDAVEYGVLTMDPGTFKFTQLLNFPVKDNNGTLIFDILVYKPRLTMKEVQDCVTSDLSQAIAYGMALTGKAEGHLGQMDSTDAFTLSSIAVFFTS